MNSQTNIFTVCGLAEDLIVNLPISEAALEYHEGLDRLAFVFEDTVTCKEIEGESGVSILVYDDRLIGFTISNFSHFKNMDFDNPEKLFAEICLLHPDFASALYYLVGSFEMGKI